MIKAIVIYDSVFGNTEQVAREIGKSLGVEARGWGYWQSVPPLEAFGLPREPKGR